MCNSMEIFKREYTGICESFNDILISLKHSQNLYILCSKLKIFLFILVWIRQKVLSSTERRNFKLSMTCNATEVNQYDVYDYLGCSLYTSLSGNEWRQGFTVKQLTTYGFFSYEIRL